MRLPTTLELIKVVFLGRIYDFKRVDQTYMNNNTWNIAIGELIDRLGHRQRSLRHLDDIYTQLCATLYNEMDSFTEYRKGLPCIGKQLCLKTILVRRVD